MLCLKSQDLLFLSWRWFKIKAILLTKAVRVVKLSSGTVKGIAETSVVVKHANKSNHSNLETKVNNCILISVTVQNVTVFSVFVDYRDSLPTYSFK